MHTLRRCILSRQDARSGGNLLAFLTARSLSNSHSRPLLYVPRLSKNSDHTNFGCSPESLMSNKHRSSAMQPVNLQEERVSTVAEQCPEISASDPLARSRLLFTLSSLQSLTFFEVHDLSHAQLYLAMLTILLVIPPLLTTVSNSDRSCPSPPCLLLLQRPHSPSPPS